MTNINMIAILTVLIAGILALGFVSRHQFDDRKATATGMASWMASDIYDTNKDNMRMARD